MTRRHLSSVEEWSIARRFLSDVLADAQAATWIRRAEQLEAARPRREDFTGAATPTELAAAYQRLTEAAHACRNRAHWLEASRAGFDDALAAFAHGHDDVVEFLEWQLRHALDRGDTRDAERLSAALDRLTIPGAAA